MNQILQALKRAKALLSAVNAPSQEPLSNGSIIQYDGDQLTKGETVYLTTGQGNWSLLPDGSYQTKKGATFVIANGVVDSVTDAPASATPATPDDQPVKQAQSATPTPITAAIDSPTDSSVQAADSPSNLSQVPEDAPAPAPAEPVIDVNDLIDARILPLVQQISDLQNAVTSLTALLGSSNLAMSAISEVVQALADAPAGTPIETVNVNPFKTTDPDIKKSRAYQIMSAKLS